MSKRPKKSGRKGMVIIMKCQYCGAEIPKGQSVCPYCDSEADTETAGFVEIPYGEKEYDASWNDRHTQTAKTIGSVIVKIVIALIVAWVVIIIASLIFISQTDSFSDAWNAAGSYGLQSNMPSDANGLIGAIESYNADGTVSINYDGIIYNGIKILDTELIQWLNETGRTLDGTEILFDTDENGNIETIAMSSQMFIILSKESDLYTACRGDQLILFTSDISLKADVCYTGYFSYPALRLVSVKQTSALPLVFMDLKCEEKRCAATDDPYSEEEITVYQIRSGGQWFYCSKEIYDTLEEGDVLSGYKFYDEPPCIIMGD